MSTSILADSVEFKLRDVAVTEFIVSTISFVKFCAAMSRAQTAPGAGTLQQKLLPYSNS